jgi:mannose-6-phosphate isomerase-like protein (cupin superfamily)
MGSDPSRLDSTFVVLDPELGATRVPVTTTVYEELDRRFGGFKGHLLVATHSFERDWPTWERHPAGDEVVVLLSGAAEFVLDRDGSHESVRLEAPGSFVIVPRGTWHTARIAASATMLFITPGEGTQNEERPGSLVKPA